MKEAGLGVQIADIYRGLASMAYSGPFRSSLLSFAIFTLFQPPPPPPHINLANQLRKSIMAQQVDPLQTTHFNRRWELIRLKFEAGGSQNWPTIDFI